LGQLDAKAPPIEKLKSLLKWALEVRLNGGMPFLPSTNANVREMLMRNLKYVTRVLKLNGKIEKLVLAAQKQGDLNPNLPSDVILFSYYSRTCDPAVDYLQTFSKMNKTQIVDHMIQVAFSGISA
jgi:hypothetical protein